MSLSWRDRCIAVLAPERVLLLRRRRGWNRTYEVQADAPCEGTTPQAAVEALALLLAPPDQGPADLTVVLSNHFVAYVLVPWRAEVTTPSELATFTGICFDETFGPEAAGRVLVTGSESAPSARVAAALDSGFLHALRTAVASSRLRLASVQPYLGAAFNGVMGALPRRDFIFVLAEPGRTCVLVAGGGQWRALRSTAGGAEPYELAALVEREAQLAGLSDEGMPPVFVHAPGRASLRLRPCHGVEPRHIAPRDAAGHADPLVEMAMTVA